MRTESTSSAIKVIAGKERDQAQYVKDLAGDLKARFKKELRDDNYDQCSKENLLKGLGQMISESASQTVERLAQLDNRYQLQAISTLMDYLKGHQKLKHLATRLDPLDLKVILGLDRYGKWAQPEDTRVEQTLSRGSQEAMHRYIDGYYTGEAITDLASYDPHQLSLEKGQWFLIAHNGSSQSDRIYSLGKLSEVYGDSITITYKKHHRHGTVDTEDDISKEDMAEDNYSLYPVPTQDYPNYSVTDDILKSLGIDFSPTQHSEYIDGKLMRGRGLIPWKKYEVVCIRNGERDIIGEKWNRGKSLQLQSFDKNGFNFSGSKGFNSRNRHFVFIESSDNESTKQNHGSQAKFKKYFVGRGVQCDTNPNTVISKHRRLSDYRDYTFRVQPSNESGFEGTLLSADNKSMIFLDNNGRKRTIHDSYDLHIGPVKGANNDRDSVLKELGYEFKDTDIEFTNGGLLSRVTLKDKAGPEKGKRYDIVLIQDKNSNEGRAAEILGKDLVFDSMIMKPARRRSAPDIKFLKFIDPGTDRAKEIFLGARDMVLIRKDD